jgi:hypothetical protein
VKPKGWIGKTAALPLTLKVENPGKQAEIGTDNVVHAAILGAIGDVESFGQELRMRFLMKRERAGEAHIEREIIRTKSRVASRADRAIVRGVVIAVLVRASQEIYRQKAP